MRVLRDDLPCANGITVHQDRLFINECRDGGRLMELDRATGASRILLEDLPSPNAMEVGPDGLLYYPLMTANEIWRIDPDGGEPQRVTRRSRRAGCGQVRLATATWCRHRWPAGRCCASTRAAGDKTLLAQLNPGLDNLTFVGDRLFVSNFTGEITEILAGGETRTALPGGLNWPLDLVVGDDGRLYVADGTYFYAVGDDGSLETVGMLFTPGYPGFLRGLAPAGPGAFVVATSGGQIARYRPGDGETDYLADGFDQLYGVAIGPGDTHRVRRTRHRQRARAAVGQRRTARLRAARPGRCGVRTRRCAAGGGVGSGPRRATGRLDRDRRRRTATAAGHPCHARVSCTSSMRARRRSSRSIWPSGERRTIAAGLPVGPPPGVNPKPLKGMPPFSGPQGPFAGITAGPDGTLYVSADGDGSVLALRRT